MRADKRTRDSGRNLRTDARLRESELNTSKGKINNGFLSEWRANSTASEYLRHNIMLYFVLIAKTGTHHSASDTNRAVKTKSKS
jgi:hypothetical protein